jgi:hypothetical protein
MHAPLECGYASRSWRGARVALAAVLSTRPGIKVRGDYSLPTVEGGRANRCFTVESDRPY